MPEVNKLWSIVDGNLKELDRASPRAERDLENWIENCISIVSPKLLLIGRQVTTGFGGAIDLLAVDRLGDLVIVELKKERTSREVVAQVLEYASWVNDLSPDRIREIAEENLKRDLDDLFKEKFGTEVPELNENHKMLIVAMEVDSSTENIIRYLSGVYGVNINVVNFEFFEDDNKNQYLLRTFMLDPFEVERTSREGGKRVRRPKISREEFLSECNPNEKMFFEKLFEMADRLKLKFSWGGTGCSIRVPTESVDVIMCFCYTPLAAFGPALYTNFRDVKQKIEAVDIEKPKSRLEETKVFVSAGDVDIKFNFSKELTESEINQIVKVFEELAKEIMEKSRSD